MTRKRGPEAVVVAACLHLLELLGIPHWRANTGAAKLGDRYVRFGEKGQPDILGILPPNGRLLCVECKSATGRLRESQSAWLERAGAAGALCVVARSVDVLMDALRKAGVS